MKKRASMIALVIASGISIVGCSKGNEVSSDISDINENTDNTYTFDTSLDKKEHTFTVEEERPILEAFTEVHQGMNPEAVKELFMRCGTYHISEIYTQEPSEYEMYDMTVTNDANEIVTVTYKDGSLISKSYRKDLFDKSNKNFVFVNYKSNLFKQEYSSGIFTDKEDFNLAENKNVWEIEEELYKLFN